jgi:hypothetical protein
MYVLVQHTITDPKTVWANAQKALGSLPSEFTLHHCVPAPHGRTAVCVWEAASPSALQNFLDRALGPAAKNEYTEVVNKEGIALPTAI